MSDTIYHPLYSTLSNTSSPSEKVKIYSAKKPSRDGHMFTSRSRFLLCIGAFLLLEGGFITLAACAMTYHITLPFSSTSLTEVKAVVNMLSIVWHATAVFMVKDIALHVFSAEWMEQVRRSRRIILDRTDIVSRVTAGYIDQIYHFISPTATRSFRLSFTSIILLLAVNWLGPGTITVNSVSLPRLTTIPLANLTITGTVSIGNVIGPVNLYSPATNRANLATRLEVMEKSVYGFQPQQTNILVPWPSSSLVSTNETIQFETDVIVYNYSCSWQIPTPLGGYYGKDLAQDVEGGIWFVGDQPYVFANRFVTGTPNYLPLDAPSVIPISGVRYQEPMETTDPSTAFLFVGSTTGHSNRTEALVYSYLNLDNLPTLFIPYKENSTFPSDSATFDSVYVTALICDPRYEIRPATATLSHGTLSADVRMGTPEVKNVPVNAANAIFAQSLLAAASLSSDSGLSALTVLVNDICAKLFLADPSTFDGIQIHSAPLPIDKINENMNNILLSSSKAYLSGYSGPNLTSREPTFSVVETDAVGESVRLALVGSKPFLIALAGLVGFLVVLFVVITVIVRADELRTFDLRQIVEVLGLHSQQY